MVAELTSVAGIDVDDDCDAVLDCQNVGGAELDTDGAALAPLEIDLDHRGSFLLCFFVQENLLSKPPVGRRVSAGSGLA
jgi:hypothetical protein